MRIELTYRAWEASVLPLNYTRMVLPVPAVNKPPLFWKLQSLLQDVADAEVFNLHIVIHAKV